MTIKTELIKNYIAEGIFDRIMDFVIDENKIPDTEAVEILGDIQEILKSGEDNDFLIVDEIVSLFIRHNLDTGGCHDF
ncbi:MAG: hypothetical protein J6D15_00845 [Clostridia bacterium]|nr:hypothetical protein [Clostridia bacterium]MBQ9758097.1 hypothetical protein [Clostridia bacterium]